MNRIRIRFVKQGKIRWTSHRDVARMWERAFRRVKLPLAYSAGFSPRPKVSFGLALPTGHESLAEYLDVELVPEASIDVSALPGRLSAALPFGVDATAAECIPAGTLSLQEDVTSCTWRWLAAPTAAIECEWDWRSAQDQARRLAARVADVLAASSVVVTRTRKAVEVTDDIRQGILDLRSLGPGDLASSHGVWLEAELACRPRSLRPSEVLLALDSGLEERDVCRTHQWILRDGARSEPLSAARDSGATDAPRAMERAS
jgi:radical SAM-linked protein